MGPAAEVKPLARMPLRLLAGMRSRLLWTKPSSDSESFPESAAEEEENKVSLVCLAPLEAEGEEGEDEEEKRRCAFPKWTASRCSAMGHPFM